MLNTKINAKVIEGKKRGAGLGYPTANLLIRKFVEPGVYAGKVMVGAKKYDAAIFMRGDKLLEAHLLDFTGDLYGKFISVELGEKIRSVMEFKNDKELKMQIKKDIEKISNS
jgi:riboflavin kinase / FMN adenylyltransferase